MLIATQGLIGTAMSEDKKSAHLTFAEMGGNPINVTIPSHQLAAAIAALVQLRAIAQANGAIEKEALLVHDFRTWEVGTNAHQDCAVLVIDKGMPSQRAYRAAPSAAREIGKALTGQARAAEKAMSKVSQQ